MEMGGDKKNRRKILCFVGGNLQGEPTKQGSLRSIFLVGREEAKPLGLPILTESVTATTVSKAHEDVRSDPAGRTGHKKEAVKTAPRHCH